ncbi:MAG: hypothetical protein ACO25L_03400 [Candidatus Nanopelagicales bacterium]|jgi:hypothetical protein
MEKKKIDRVIESFRNYAILKEEMMTTQSTTGKPGFSTSADAAGPVAGRSPKMFFMARKFTKKYAKGGPGSRKVWLDYLKSSNGRRN